jgi:two-component system OmpR family response regulator
MKQTMGKVRHIVVVDSDRSLRTSLVDYLRKNGFSASGTADPHTLTRIGDQRRTDLAIIELVLPNEAGLALCASVRGNLRIPVIATSANAEDVDRILALEVGADDFMTKPFNPREMLARIRNVLRRSDAALQVAGQSHHPRDLWQGIRSGDAGRDENVSDARATL